MEEDCVYDATQEFLREVSIDLLKIYNKLITWLPT